ncbi:hypothetical protein, partial [Treponema socranskii]|uniref:hypothetical protein n=1 Tax=Treponema socranskii TaxID=53419 RepID=UPI00361FC5F6
IYARFVIGDAQRLLRTARNLIGSREAKNGFAVFLLSARRLSYLILSDVIKGMKADCNSL